MVFIGGGMNLFDLMKGGVVWFVMFIDIMWIVGFDMVDVLFGGGMCIGVFVCNSDVVDYLCLCVGYLLLL